MAETQKRRTRGRASKRRAGTKAPAAKIVNDEAKARVEAKPPVETQPDPTLDDLMRVLPFRERVISKLVQNLG